MWSNLNIAKLVLDMTPTFLRKSRLVAFPFALVVPLIAIYDDWVRMREDHLYRLEHNGQICYLRKSLNDIFDVSLRRIYIGNGNQFDRKYIYTNAEQKPQFLGTMFIHSRLDYADTGVDFIVYVPSTIVDLQLYELRAHIDWYKEGSKKYKIVRI